MLWHKGAYSKSNSPAKYKGLKNTLSENNQRVTFVVVIALPAVGVHEDIYFTCRLKPSCPAPGQEGETGRIGLAAVV